MCLIEASAKPIPGAISTERYKCKYPDKTFIISGFSKSQLYGDSDERFSRQSVYYSDKRTSKKCKCSNCSKDNPMLGLGNKCIGISDIILVCSRLQSTIT